MLNAIKSPALCGAQHIIRGNQTIPLNDSNAVWIVESGCIEIFSITPHDRIESARRYLFNVNQGEALFGGNQTLLNLLTGSAQVSRQLLAVPMGEATLLKLDQDCIEACVADARIIHWIEAWLQNMDSVLSELPKLAQAKVAGKTHFSLVEGELFQPDPDPIVWVQIQQGDVYWMGFQEFTLTPSTGIVPLTRSLWLKSKGSAQILTQPTAALQDVSILLQGISQFHCYLLQYTYLREQEEQREEEQRLAAQLQLNQQVTEAALEALASTFRPQEPEFLREGIPLLVAAGAVGKAAGISIRPLGKSVDLSRVRDPLEAILRASRVRGRRVLLQDNWWQQDCGPLLAFIQATQQPVALLPDAADRYILFDSIHDSRTLITADVAQTVVPFAYMFYRPLPDRALKAIDLLRFALKNRAKDLLMILLTGIAVTLLGMLTPYATSILIDSAIPDGDRGLLLQVGLGLFVVAIGIALFRLAQGLFLLRLETSSDAATQAAVWDRLLTLPVSFFRQYTVGDLQSRVMSVSQIRRQLGGTTLINLTSALFALLNLGLLLYYSFKLALIAVVVAAVVILVTFISSVLLIRKVRPLLELRGALFGQTVQLINGISKLRVANAESRAFAFWSKTYHRQIKLDLGTQYIEDGIALFNTVMPTLTSAVLFWFTIQLMTAPEAVGLSIGTFLAFNTAFGTFIKGATDLSNTLTGALQIVPQWKRAQPILATVPEVDLSKADPGQLKGRIIVDRISFRYRQEGASTLNDVSLYAEPGEFVALVGSSGSGKSTLLRLLLGFETPEMGAVYYDGQDLAGLDVDAVRRQMGVVLQSGRILSASIFENIASGAHISLDEAWEAAQMAGLAEDITAMPMQMHTVISEGGGNLSGGQRQRLLIARALALKPRILLFDEATSALDNKTQAIVSDSLDRLQATRLVIAHRLSTIRNADRIYVLQAGRIVQQGSFTELENQAGLFAQLMGL
ncbi:NHLP bacteriocin export ABC transporter permease/ATPase subunit [Leptolyngbya sp. FACHB-671]|uniref:NHLP bacteriocin export ABC transporter permease/ATPase subunit n=1 Tax=Leptolyngbya sp. FACHB-671 TaxID=2692812 RepID=UPI001681ED6A|nr:NHLP bacteriocin export ABC transporter permease/ATPase subunit [Leptolyngbya sp. FACHB-671]MBD2069522.1 NHLP bacteriocin export ABC transporter permease/ATPase subunit [Leptolyngbya sp. FACHB-671]